MPTYELLGDKLIVTHSTHNGSLDHIVRVVEDPSRALPPAVIRSARSEEWWRSMRAAMELPTPFDRVLAVAKLGCTIDPAIHDFTLIDAIYSDDLPWTPIGASIYLVSACEVIRSGPLNEGEARIIRLQREGNTIAAKVLA
jgi:hypothetical protein